MTADLLPRKDNHHDQNASLHMQPGMQQPKLHLPRMPDEGEVNRRSGLVHSPLRALSMPALDLPDLLSRRASFLSFVKRRVKDRTLAEDILQAAYMRALESARSSNHSAPDSSVAWFYSVLRNAVIDHYRRGTTEASAMERWKREFGDSEPTVPEAPAQDFVCGCIEHVLPRLKPAYAELLREVDLAEVPLTEFAARHQLSAGNAGVRAHRARAALRKALSEFCGACSMTACLDCICKRPAKAGSHCA